MLQSFHSATGTICGLFLPPGAAQAAGFFSHFIFDALPHRDLDAVIKNKKTLYFAAAADLAGAFLVYALIMVCAGLTPFNWHTFLSAAAAVLPDVDKLCRHLPVFRKLFFWFDTPVDYLHRLSHQWQNNERIMNDAHKPCFRWQFAAIVFIIAGTWFSQFF